METVKKDWYKNEWIVAIGSGVIILLIPPIFDLIRGDPFTRSFISIWNMPFRLGWAIVVSIASLFLTFLLKRMSKGVHDPLFDEGTRVIIKTNHRPVMVTGKVNTKANMVLCSWTINHEVKSEWINQNLLKPYEDPEYTPRTTRPSDFWNRY